MMKRLSLLIFIAATTVMAAHAQDAAQTIFMKGVEQARAKQFTEAIASFSQFARIEPNEPAAPFNIGVCYYSMEHYADALPYFVKTISLQPNYIDAYVYEGNTLDFLGRHD